VRNHATWSVMYQFVRKRRSFAVPSAKNRSVTWTNWERIHESTLRRLKRSPSSVHSVQSRLRRLVASGFMQRFILEQKPTAVHIAIRHFLTYASWGNIWLFIVRERRKTDTCNITIFALRGKKSSLLVPDGISFLQPNMWLNLVRLVI
jgi:hypothetical protein